MLQLQSISKSFGGVHAVRACTFSCERGKVTALIGPNGAGKTTVLDLVSGVTRPDSGRVVLDGRDITWLPPESVASAGVSRTFQAPRLFNNLSARQNVLLALNGGDEGFWRGLWKPGCDAALLARANDALASVRLSNHVDVPCRELSYGQRKLVELARSLAQPHGILLLDEPLAGVNPAVREEIASIASGLRARGETILMVEHDLDFVSRVADRVVVMAEGRVIAEGTPAQVKANRTVVDAYLG